MPLLSLALACASDDPVEPPDPASAAARAGMDRREPTAGPGPRVQPALQVSGSAVPLPGLCEPSGAARHGDGPIWVVDDDQRDTLFAWAPPAAPTRHPLPGEPVKDAEGLAFDPDGGLWITGGMGRGGKKDKVGKRGVVARVVAGPEWSLDLATDALRPGKDKKELVPLLAAIAAKCADCALPSDASGTEDGRAFDIEGLAWDPAGRLLFGLRAPLVGDRAVVFSVDPIALRQGAPMARIVKGAWALDLGRRGIRDLGLGPSGSLLVLAGGPSGRETPRGALYSWWPGDAPRSIGPLPVLGGDAEAVVADGDRAAWLFLDEGKRLSEGLRKGGPHARQDDGETVFSCGAGRPTDWAHAIRVTW